MSQVTRFLCVLIYLLCAEYSQDLCILFPRIIATDFLRKDFCGTEDLASGGRVIRHELATIYAIKAALKPSGIPLEGILLFPIEESLGKILFPMDAIGKHYCSLWMQQ